jgi:hypothetical protein
MHLSMFDKDNREARFGQKQIIGYRTHLNKNTRLVAL